MIYKTTLLVFMLTGCGDFEIKQKDDSKLADEDAENQDKDEENIPKTGTFNKTDVAVDVNVAVNVNEITGDNVPEIVYRSATMTWDQAVETAPDGYRLATRSEVIAMHEDGKLKAVVNSGDSVWTASEYSVDGMAYFYAFVDSADWPGSKGLMFGAIYVLDMQPEIVVE